jgi:hypothetical protein
MNIARMEDVQNHGKPGSPVALHALTKVVIVVLC